jgi:hypothetical protein
MTPVASSLALKINLWVKVDDSFTTNGKIIICLAYNKSIGCSMKSVGATCTYKEQATEFFDEESALNTDAAIFDLKKQILHGYVQLDAVHEYPLVETQNARISVLFGKVLQATYSRPVYTSKTLTAYLL